MSRVILLVVDVMSREKNVSKDVIFAALELALASATKKRFHEDVEVRVDLDRDTGEYSSVRLWHVVPDDAVEFPERQIDLTGAKVRNPEIELDDYIEELLEPVEFGRIGSADRSA